MTKVITDSNPMQYFLSHRQINGKFSRWIVILQEYDLEFSTHKRKKSLALAEIVTTFPSNTTSAPSIPTSPTNIAFTSLQTILGTTTSSSTSELKILVTTFHEMIVIIFTTRPLAISSSKTSYTDEGSTPFFIDA
jgi:hypothetical protein